MNKLAIPAILLGLGFALAPTLAANAEDLPPESTFSVSELVCGEYSTYVVMTTTYADGNINQTHLAVSDVACPKNPQPDPFVPVVPQPVQAPVAQSKPAAAPVVVTPAVEVVAPTPTRVALPGFGKAAPRN